MVHGNSRQPQFLTRHAGHTASLGRRARYRPGSLFACGQLLRHKRLNYFEMHMGDWSKATGTLSLMNVGVYTRLVCHYYDQEGPLPGSLLECCRIAGARNPAEREAVAYVLGRFFKPHDGGWFHERCEEDLARYRAKITKAKKAASSRWTDKSGARPNPEKPNGINGSSMRPHAVGISERNALQTPDLIHSEPKGSGAGAPVEPGRSRLLLHVIDMAANGLDRPWDAHRILLSTFAPGR